MMLAIERKARWALESGQESHSMEAQSNGFPAQCASIIAWSCATLSVRNDHLFEILAQLVGPRLRELKPYEAHDRFSITYESLQQALTISLIIVAIYCSYYCIWYILYESTYKLI